MLSLGFEAPNAKRMAVRFQAASIIADDRASAVTKHYGRILVQRVRELAPKDTGDYARGIRMYSRGSRGRAYVSVQTPAPFAMRLEYGFFGADSLGRQYWQEPQPHWRPAAASISGEFLNALEREIDLLDL